MTEQMHMPHGDPEPKASERSFGFVFTGVFLIIGLFPLLGGGGVRWWSIVLAVLFLAAALFIPRLLAPLNRVWMAIGNILHKVVSPLVLGLLFLIAVVPTGLYLRLMRKDPLRLKRNPAAKTYWEDRTPPGPQPGSFKNQF